MTIDPKGTSPGLANGARVEPKKISMGCKNEFCTSIQVVEVTPQAGVSGSSDFHNRTYQCCVCNSVWTVPTGGFVNL
jgi:hypothetical protein